LVTYDESGLSFRILADPEFGDSFVRVHGKMQTHDIVGFTCRVFVVRHWRPIPVEIALQDRFAKKKERIAECPWLIPVKTLYISPTHDIRERDLGRKLHRRRRHSPSYLARTG
jgi:hypothetical protein